MSAVELSALRLSELLALVNALPSIDLSQFESISFHAPSGFNPHEEGSVIDLLRQVCDLGFPVVVHPDVIYSVKRWAPFRSLLLIENMDKRKPVGRTADELAVFFRQLPEARLCFDVGHVRQIDPTMAEAVRILDQHGNRLAEVPLSEVHNSSKHEALSEDAVEAFQSIAGSIPENIPVILESLIDRGQSDIATEIRQARRALPSRTLSVLASI